VSEAKLLPPLQIMARSLNQKFYKILAAHPSGEVTIVAKDSLFTPKSNGTLTVLKADIVDILE
jgi:hypothetical protein